MVAHSRPVGHCLEAATVLSKEGIECEVSGHWPITEPAPFKLRICQGLHIRHGSYTAAWDVHIPYQSAYVCILALPPIQPPDEQPWEAADSS